MPAGGGAWGTALAAHAARMGHETVLWAREKEVVAAVDGPEKENSTFLKVRLPAHSPPASPLLSAASHPAHLACPDRTGQRRRKESEL